MVAYYSLLDCFGLAATLVVIPLVVVVVLVPFAFDHIGGIYLDYY